MQIDQTWWSITTKFTVNSVKCITIYTHEEFHQYSNKDNMFVMVYYKIPLGKVVQSGTIKMWEHIIGSLFQERKSSSALLMSW